MAPGNGAGAPEGGGGGGGSGPPSRTPSIMDSPTLARVERARLRQEAAAANGAGGGSQPHLREDSLERVLLDPKKSLLIGRIPVAQMTGPIKRGLLWQQRDRLFSRWKERYFILTRDYLNCFKRSSGSASEKISDMGQFIFKIKLVDVEKVEWLNRRSYSAIGLLLGSREGRVLLRCDHGLEDWFELLEECTLSSKERRRALRLTQGPRSRASLAAPVSHASLQSNHLGLGGTYSGAIEDWLMSRHHKAGGGHHNHHHLHHFLHSDSVPDLSTINENHGLTSGLLTNHSTPKKVPNARHNLSGSSTNGYNSHNGSFCNGFPYSPLKKLSDNFINGNSTYIINDEDEEVELRRGGRYRVEQDDLYRRPLGPAGNSNDNNRHSPVLTDLDFSACDSGLDTPPSTHRPSSCRDNMYLIAAYNHHNQSHLAMMNGGKDKTTDTGISSSRGTLVSPANSIRHGLNGNNNNNSYNMNSYGSRYSVQEQKILRARNNHPEETNGKNSIRSIRAEFFEQNKYNNNNNNHLANGSTNNSPAHNGGHHYHHGHQHQHQHLVGSNGNIHQQQQHHHHVVNGLNNNQQQQPHFNGNSINSTNGNGTAALRDRYQHPALAAIINESQGMKFRDRSYSDCQQQVPRRQWTSNTPSPKRIPYLGTPPTRV
ncbi:homeobox protein 2 isoform X1 [Culex pipiens pallens]|uniref:homeobox protein 2 isoform X1 n=2 Tax=Culex pipiens pallens TaxID=42434 RepID=UPI0019535E4B|nr:homeobox protein 2 isoform X1 [Culex pipiens pallens]XP_039449465.1 homeobox protein 2 isoform X1 [Culex pipiens pallens]XP_039449475.1 homeobox protein 2 isoform X1 [Culex pipiens pallens]XP_052563521.1 homeobox protein 2 isoform X1 [Culex pipiens pallens]